MKLSSRSKRFFALLISIASIVAVVLSLRSWLRRTFLSETIQPAPKPETDLSFSGLSTAQAAARLPKIDLEALHKKQLWHFTTQAVWKNLFTLFNFDLIGMVVILYLLGSPLSALFSFIVLLLAVGFNTFQEVFTKNKLDRMVENIQPQATVIRDGYIQSIDRWQVVKDDLLIVRRGDQILVEGLVVSSQSLIMEEQGKDGIRTRQVHKQEGDQLFAGSYCISGHATYQTQAGGEKYIGDHADTQIKLFQQEPTPLQRMMRVVFIGLLVLVLVFSAFLLLDAIDQNAQLVSAEYRDAFSIIFALGPTSLFLVLIVQYAVGSLRFMEYGALIYQSEKIEALSNVSTVCFSEESLYSQLQIRFEAIPVTAGEQKFSETLVQEMLGDILHSLPILDLHRARTLIDTLPGIAHSPLETVPYLNTFGWYGASFNQDDLRGTFILGRPDVLARAIRKEKASIGAQVESSLSKTRQRVNTWLQKIIRKDDGTKDFDEPEFAPSLASDSSTEEAQSEKKSFWHERVVPNLLGLLESIEEKESISTGVSWEGEETFLFVYLPDPVSLYDENYQPRLPEELIPLSYIHISDTIRPELRQVLQSLSDDGVQVKMLSTASPQRVIATAHKMGLDENAIQAIPSTELTDLSPQDYDLMVKSANVFADLTPSQKAKIVKTLRKNGDYVAMVGADINDIPAMRQAQVSFALQSGNPAVLQHTDIVLLKDTLQVLPRLLFLGQRMVNGALDMFKLYLSQVGAQLLILLYMIIFQFEQFPYHPTQGGVINFFAIVVPNILLSVWAAGGRLDLTAIRRRMIHFIVPSAILLSILGSVVYALFMKMDFGTHYPPAELIKKLEISDPQLFFAQQAVVYAFLFAGWLRVLFLQPPSKFWVGGSPLRGDRRVIGLVIASVLVFIIALIFPWLPLQEWLRITWLPSLRDYLLLGGMALAWALILRSVWRVLLRLTKVFAQDKKMETRN